MKNVTIKKANKFWLFVFYIMAKCYGVNKIIGFTTFWNTIILDPTRLNSNRLIAHELTHIEQINNLGIIKFTYEYIVELYKNGYKNNKFEVQARNNEINPELIMNKFNITYKY